MSDLLEYLRQTGNFRREMLSKMPDLKYQSIEELLAAEGHEFVNRDPFTPAEREQLTELRQHLSPKTWRTRECYQNAFRLADG